MAKRLINTSQERGINEEEIMSAVNNPEEMEALGIDEDIPEGVEEKTIESPQDLAPKEKEIDIEKLTTSQIEEKYTSILNKLENGDKVTKEEQDFKDKVDSAIAKGQQAQELEYKQKLLEEKEKQLSEKEEFLKDYLKVKEQNPEKIITAGQKGIGLDITAGLPTILKFIYIMKRVKKKGGKVLVQVHKNKKVNISWTLEDISYVVFYTKDEKGNVLEEVTRFNEFIYNYEGSPIPVLFAVQGVAEGYNFFEKFEKNITSEMVSRLTSRAYHAGYEKGAELVNPTKKNGFLEGLQPLVPLILIIGLLVLGWMMWQMYGEITSMQQAVTALKANATLVVR